MTEHDPRDQWKALRLARCFVKRGDEETALLLDSIPGRVITLGDNAFEDGTAQEFADCYEPTWGRHKNRTRPAVGNHEYQTPDAAGYFGYFGAAAGDPDKRRAVCQRFPGGREEVRQRSTQAALDLLRRLVMAS